MVNNGMIYEEAKPSDRANAVLSGGECVDDSLDWLYKSDTETNSSLTVCKVI